MSERDPGDVAAAAAADPGDGASRRRSAASDPDCGQDCAEALRELERYLDGELPGSRLDGIRSHLSDCYPCADRATFEEQVRALVRERCAESAPTDLIDRIRVHLQTLTEDAG